MSVPKWCPNLGVCGFPDCVYDDEECAQAETLAADDGDGGPEPEPTPHDDEPFVPLTAADIDWNWRG